VFRRLGDGRIASYEELFPSVTEGSLINPHTVSQMQGDSSTAGTGAVAGVR